MDLESGKIAVDSNPESDCTASPKPFSTPQLAENVDSLAHENDVKSPLSTDMSLSDGSLPPSKGFGLRKWRRIRREVVKDDCVISDAVKALKRGPSFPQNVNKPSTSIVAEALHNSEDSSGSVNMLMDPFNVPSASYSNPIFAAQGVDSEHSDSRSSTAASAQRPRHSLQSTSNHGKEKHEGKSTPNSFPTLSRYPLEERVKDEGSKKQRGGESEHSHSSLESDSRSFAQEVTSTNRSAMNLGSDSSLQFNISEPLIIEGVNGNDDFTPSEDNETHFPDKIEENGFSSEQGDQKLKSLDESFLPGKIFLHPYANISFSWLISGGFLNMNGKMADPLADTLKELESLHAALQSELNKFGEIRTENGARLISDDERSTCNDDVEDDERMQVVELRKMVNELESKLEEAVQCQNAKESKCESEVEDIFRQMIEAEIAYLTMSESLKRVSVCELKEPLTLMEKGSDRRMCLLSVVVLVVSVILWFLLTELDLQRLEVVPT